MSEEEKRVALHADHGSDSLGNDAYFAARDGKFAKRGFRSSLFVAVCLMGFIFVVLQLTSRSPMKTGGKEITTPTVSRVDPPLSPKLFTSRDFTNVISQKGQNRSAFGKIRIVSLRSISQIPIGSEVRAVLESGATDGIVKARVIAPLLVDGEPIVPEGAILFGKGKSGDERLMVEFKKVIFPSGESFPIRAQAFDSSDKILGLKGALVGSRTKKMAGALAFGFVGGMADGLQDTSGTSLFYGRRPSVRDGALAGASKAALDQSQLYLDELKRSPNVIEVSSGKPILVIFDEPKRERTPNESE